MNPLTSSLSGLQMASIFTFVQREVGDGTFGVLSLVIKEKIFGYDKNQIGGTTMKPSCLWAILFVFLTFCFLGCGEDENPFEGENIFFHQPIDPYAEMAKKYAQAIDYTNPTTRDYAVQLAALCPGEYSICQICKIYDYLYKNWRYVNDPHGLDYVSPASRTIQANLAGDCDDYAVLMAAMIAAIGGTPHIIIAWNNDVGHAYAEVFVGNEENLNAIAEWIRDYYRNFFERLFGINVVGPISYHKESSGDCWLNLDWTSKFPGGPFFEATREIAVSLNGTYKVIK
jgi:hypothetical protein